MRSKGSNNHCVDPAGREGRSRTSKFVVLSFVLVACLMGRVVAGRVWSTKTKPSRVIRISTRGQTLLLRANATVWGFGENNSGQLAYEHPNEVEVIESNPFTRAIAGIKKKLGFRPRMKAAADEIGTPRELPGLANVTAVAAGYLYSVVLKSDGSVWTFGANVGGQLGYEVPPDPFSVVGHTAQPTRVPDIADAVAIAAAEHTVVLKRDGTVWTFGSNESWQLGWGPFELSNTTPQPVPGLDAVTAVAAGEYHTVALKRDGTVWTFGSGGMGQRGAVDHSSIGPDQVSGLSEITAIAVGDRHNVALKRDGTVWTFGANGYGQLGYDSENDSSEIPKQVPGLTGVVAVAAGADFTVVLKKDGTVWTFGHDQYGQLGSGRPASGESADKVESTSDEIYRFTPKPVRGLGGVVSIAAGGATAAVVKSDGTAWLFGAVSDTELGEHSGEVGNAHFTSTPRECKKCSSG
jgi:alpha-tubulin suppressor-like RCC1 family protein